MLLNVLSSLNVIPLIIRIGQSNKKNKNTGVNKTTADHKVNNMIDMPTCIADIPIHTVLK